MISTHGLVETNVVTQNTKHTRKREKGLQIKYRLPLTLLVFSQFHRDDESEKRKSALNSKRQNNRTPSLHSVHFPMRTLPQKTPIERRILLAKNKHDILATICYKALLMQHKGAGWRGQRDREEGLLSRDGATHSTLKPDKNKKE
jgi:hypothetical protein